MTRSTPKPLPRIFLLLSRTLLLLVGMLLVVIPWSERYCALDNFPKGQDFETNLLAFLALLSLMLLLAHLCRQSLAALFSIHYRIFRLNFSRSEVHVNHLASFAIATHRVPLPSPLPSAFNLPLQI